jgi:hypothetical protein
MRAVFAVLLAASSLTAKGLHAQILDVQPAHFTEPRAGNRARHGEVVLGRTTVAGSRRMFAELLNSDSIKVARGHPGNPSQTRPGTAWQVASHRVEAGYRLDLGPDRYTLYFDKNERLIAATGGALPGALTRADLAARYPSLQKDRRWYSGNRPHLERWTTVLDTCVTLVVSVLLPHERVDRLTYVYTCPTSGPTPKP